MKKKRSLVPQRTRYPPFFLIYFTNLQYNYNAFEEEKRKGKIRRKVENSFPARTVYEYIPTVCLGRKWGMKIRFDPIRFDSTRSGYVATVVLM